MRYNWTLRGRAKGRAHPTTGHSPGAWAGLAAALAASMVIAGYAAVEPAPRARLSAVSAKVAVRGASVLIEASEPVAYVTTRPDPLTVVVDLRNVTAAGVSNRVSGSHVFLIAAVTTEDARGADGAPVARVRVLLAAPAQHQVRSDRNVIHVDVVPDDDSPARSGWPVPRGFRRPPRRPPRERSRRCPCRQVRPTPSRPRAARRRPCPRSPKCRPSRRQRRGRSRARLRSCPRRLSSRAQLDALLRPPGEPRFPGSRPAVGASDLLGDQRPRPRHRSDRPGDRRRRAA